MFSLLHSVACRQCRWHTDPTCSVYCILLHADSVDGTPTQLVQYKTVNCVVLHNKKHETSYHLIIRDCPFDNFIMLYQLLKMRSTIGINQDVSVYCIVQSMCLFQWMVVNHRDCLSCVAA